MLQVVILRDGLLVGTEVFVPGQYTLGSGEGVDLKLDDPTVAAAHASLFFQNGRAAIQDAGGGAVFVNGHRVNACEVRPVDEISCGPFTLKVRVLAQKPAGGKPSASPEMAALLGGSPPAVAPIKAVPGRSAPVAVPSNPPGVSAISTGGSSATVVSSRRMTAAPQSSPSSAQRNAAPHLRPVELGEEAVDEDEKTQAVALGSETAPTMAARPALIEPSAPRAPAAAANAPTPVAAKAPQAPKPAAPAIAAVVAKPAAAPAPAPAPHHGHKKHEKKSKHAKHAAPAPAGKRTGPRPMPAIPVSDGKGRPHLFVESYWGETRKYAKSYNKIDPKKKLQAREDDTAPLPLWGYHLEGKSFTFAEQSGDMFRVYVPPQTAVERKAQDGNFYPVELNTLEGTNSSRFITLATGHAVRFTSSSDDMALVAYVQPPIPRPFVNPLKGLPWLAIGLLGLFGGAFIAFTSLAPNRDGADFEGRAPMPVAVRLIAPLKPEEKKKIEKKIEEIKKKEEKPKPKEVAKVEKAKPAVTPPETKKALKTLEKLTAAGPAMKDLLAAVDKLGSGPGAKNAKNDFKLSGLLGKAPIANAGIGTFGLGGGGGGGMGIKGAELLRGKGGAGIGALGAGNIGKGSVAGSVSKAISRTVGAQGNIDKEAVAKAINAHLAEVSSCYERALLKEPGLSGKIILEWQITTSGTVGYAKTKSSSMRSAAVESCIINSLKSWHFPAAKGAGVVITYPFMFNSVGY